MRIVSRTSGSAAPSVSLPVRRRRKSCSVSEKLAPERRSTAFSPGRESESSNDHTGSRVAPLCPAAVRSSVLPERRSASSVVDSPGGKGVSGVESSSAPCSCRAETRMALAKNGGPAETEKLPGIGESFPEKGARESSRPSTLRISPASPQLRATLTGLPLTNICSRGPGDAGSLLSAPGDAEQRALAVFSAGNANSEKSAGRFFSLDGRNHRKRKSPFVLKFRGGLGRVQGQFDGAGGSGNCAGNREFPEFPFVKRFARRQYRRGQTDADEDQFAHLKILRRGGPICFRRCGSCRPPTGRRAESRGY